VAGGRVVPGCLDLPNDKPRSQQVAGDPIVVRECDGTNSQKWGKLGVQSTPSQPRFRLSNQVSAMSADRVSNISGQPATVRQKPDSGGIAVNSMSWQEG
jgi:hypothetical protein